MRTLTQILVDDAFLHLSAPLPQELEQYHKGYLQGLTDYRRHLLKVLREREGEENFS